MSNVDKNTGIWSLEIARKRHKCDYFLAQAIATLYYPKAFADIGCGDGKYCRFFKSLGWRVDGYEGTDNITSLGTYDNIRTVDLTKIGDIALKYDLVLCLEVGEHIPEKYEQMFIDNLCKFVQKDLILSWANKDQYSASGHVNGKPSEYIIEEFSKRGFKCNKSKTNLLREYSFFDWFKKNILVFHER